MSASSAVFAAIAAKDANALQAAIAAGEDPDQVSPRGGTPLLQAVNKGHRPCVTCLLDAGASPDPPGDWSPLMEAAARKPRWFVDTLIAAGAKVDRQRDESTALHHAVRGRRVDSVIALLEAGASTEIGAHDGGALCYTPLHIASFSGFCEIAARLLVGGADPNTGEGRRNQSPLSFAISRKNRRLVRLLLAHGAQPVERWVEPRLLERLAELHPLPRGVFCDLDEAVAQPDAVMHLDLFGHGLKAIPEVNLPNLTTARVGNNLYKRIPDAVYRWTSLQTLAAVQMHPKFLDPTRLAQFPNLKRLIVGNLEPDRRIQKIAKALPGVEVSGWEILRDHL